MVRSPVPRKILGVIPARLASSRFPRKVLAPLASKPMLQHVWERASKARYLTSILIATDDEQIYEVARNFGARVRMTRSDHASGTDRAAEIASVENCDMVVNIQGDEPLIDPDAIDAAILPMAHDSEIQMATLKKRIADPSEITNPNVVKVITDLNGDAIYFSRLPIPYHRDASREAASSLAPGPRPPAPFFKHIGLYLYQRDFLLAYPTLPVGPLEQAERLEQLRALENGLKIRVVETDYESLGVDTPEDLERVATLFAMQTVEEHG
jgi:3-deoxy-manno-octulosonate cytidylyltransferase (CMP-KDO synthetase)